jgi:AraC-like DNA-binding protein
MGVSVKRVQFADYEALRYAVQDAPQEIVQLENGPMTGEINHLTVGPISISTGHFSRGIRGRGLVSTRNRWNFSMLVDGDGAVVCRAPIKPGDSFIVRPDQEIYVAHQHAGHYSAINVPEDVVLAHVEAQETGLADAALWQQASAVLPLDLNAATERVAAFRLLIEVLITDGPSMSAELVKFHEHNLLELVTAPLYASDGKADEPVIRAAELVQQIDRYLVAAEGPVHVAELTGNFRVPRRTMMRAFHDVLGIPPITFLRNKRLGDVHSELRQGGIATMVRDVARKHGFLQLGKFAAEYFRLFGEYPRETLRRAQAALSLLMIWGAIWGASFCRTSTMALVEMAVEC